MTDVVKAIERLHKDLCRDAQAGYDKEMKSARKRMETIRRRVRAAEAAFRTRQETADVNHKQALREALRWRDEAIASARRLTNANDDGNG